MMQNSTITPELSCSNLPQSLDFYTRVLGFNIVYERAETGFAMLEREGSRFMLEQLGDADRWRIGHMEKPFGRGVNFQIHTKDVDALYKSVVQNKVDIFVPIEECWYRANDVELGNRQFLIMDPDGYLLRFFTRLGERGIQ